MTKKLGAPIPAPDTPDSRCMDHFSIFCELYGLKN